ncbi:MAG: ribonuclease III [Actinomycetes bacterium]|nr:ribonuclease III [Actinomycetes bacterium]
MNDHLTARAQACADGPDLDARIDAVERLMEHRFADRELVAQAITHPSAVDADPHYSYERLEFLGDAVVGLCVAEYAYRRYPDLREGDLTKMRVAVVNGSFLSEKQEELGFADLLVLGASEQGQDSRGMASALEDSFESLTGALYLDAGYAAAYGWVIKCLGEYVNPQAAHSASSPKSELQELVQRAGGQVTYRIVKATGPAHAPHFVAEVAIGGAVLARGEGASKKDAEAEAAAGALEQVASGGLRAAIASAAGAPGVRDVDVADAPDAAGGVD